MTKLRLTALCLSLALLVPSTANATLIDGIYTLTASDFTDPGFAPVSVTFSLKFDTSADITDDITSINQISSNTYGPLRIGYNSSTDVLAIGGGLVTTLPAFCSLGPGSFCGFIEGFGKSSPISRFFVSESFTGIATTTQTSLVQEPSAAVPEPTTWAMLLTGFAGIAFAMRRKRVEQTVRSSGFHNAAGPCSTSCSH